MVDVRTKSEQHFTKCNIQIQEYRVTPLAGKFLLLLLFNNIRARLTITESRGIKAADNGTRLATK